MQGQALLISLCSKHHLHSEFKELAVTWVMALADSTWTAVKSKPSQEISVKLKIKNPYITLH